MSILAPLALFFLLSVPLTILLYLLKLRRTDKPISSTLLWRQSIEDLKANTPFQKLRSNLLLFLQILIFILLAFAIARPTLRLSGLETGSLIVLIDTSASMSSTDVAPSRLEYAKNQVRRLINNLGRGESMMLISFSSGSQVVSPFTNDRRNLAQSLNSISPTEQPTDITEALGMAYAAARTQVRSEILILSDGVFHEPELDQSTDIPIRFVTCGTRSDNVGITAVGTRRNFEIQGQYQLTITVQNSSPTQREMYVEIYGRSLSAAEDQEERAELLDARSLTVPAGESSSLVIDDPGYFSSLLELRLDVQDDLSVDNRAYVVLPQKQAVKVLVVSSGGYFLQRALNVDPRSVISTISPGDYISNRGYDLVVFDHFVPARLGPGRYVFIGCVPPFPECSLGGEIQTPLVVDWNRIHPLTRYAQMNNLTIQKANKLNLPSWAEVLVEARETPLIALLQSGATTSLIVGFDFYDSDWPLRASFPIFFSNLLDWFIATDPESMRMVYTGDVFLIPAVETGPYATVRTPSGEEREIQLSGEEPTPFASTLQTGFYEVSIQNQDALVYACNLADFEETAVMPQRRLSAGLVEIEGFAEIEERNREIWWPVAFCALLVFLLEWLVYTRRARYGI